MDSERGDLEERDGPRRAGLRGEVDEAPEGPEAGEDLDDCNFLFLFFYFHFILEEREREKKGGERARFFRFFLQRKK